MTTPGWKLVPVEPTTEMVEAPFADKAEPQCMTSYARARTQMAANYRAMIAAAPLHAVDAPVGGEQALQALFLDAIQWGRSYGQSRNVTDELLQEVAAGFAEKAALASTSPSAPGMASVDAAEDAQRWRFIRDNHVQYFEPTRHWVWRDASGKMIAEGAASSFQEAIDAARQESK